jgi:hypothetical protein
VPSLAPTETSAGTDDYGFRLCHHLLLLDNLVVHEAIAFLLLLYVSTPDTRKYFCP